MADGGWFAHVGYEYCEIKPSRININTALHVPNSILAIWIDCASLDTLPDSIDPGAVIPVTSYELAGILVSFADVGFLHDNQLLNPIHGRLPSDIGRSSRLIASVNGLPLAACW